LEGDSETFKTAVPLEQVAEESEFEQAVEEIEEKEYEEAQETEDTPFLMGSALNGCGFPAIEKLDIDLLEESDSLANRYQLGEPDSSTAKNLLLGHTSSKNLLLGHSNANEQTLTSQSSIVIVGKISESPSNSKFVLAHSQSARKISKITERSWEEETQDTTPTEEITQDTTPTEEIYHNEYFISNHKNLLKSDLSSIGSRSSEYLIDLIRDFSTSTKKLSHEGSYPTPVTTSTNPENNDTQTQSYLNLKRNVSYVNC
jgi:hypothetical protein